MMLILMLSNVVEIYYCIRPCVCRKEDEDKDEVVKKWTSKRRGNGTL